MKTKPDSWYRQSAAAPLRVVDGRLEVLLVTSLGGGKWILPKGIVEEGMTPAESAAKEAWEEAGVKGRIAVSRLGVFRHAKWGAECAVEVFRLDVTRVFDDWLEKGERKRRWFPLEEAVMTVSPGEAGEVLARLGLPPLRLTLLRHAKSSWKDSGADDHERPLNERGEKDAPEMGERLARRGRRPGLIVSSTAERARRTALVVAGKLGYPVDGIIEEPAVYLASATRLLALVRDLPEGARDVMLVGHNPGMTDFANIFLKERLDEIPTCGFVTFEFDAAGWRDITPEGAKLLEYDYPKNKK